MGNKIQNIEELRYELKRLKNLRPEREAALNKDIKDFQNKFSTVGKVLGFLSPFGNKNSLSVQSPGMTGLGMMLVDKLLLNNSGTVVKVISELLYTKLASNISKDDIGGLIDKIKNWFKRSDKKESAETKTEDKNNSANSDQLE